MTQAGPTLQPVDALDLLAIGRRIQLVRKTRNLQQSDIATKLGVHEATVSGWETGRKDMGLINLNAMADVLGVSVDYLLGRTDHQDGLPLGKVVIDMPKVEVIRAATRIGQVEELRSDDEISWAFPLTRGMAVVTLDEWVRLCDELRNKADALRKRKRFWRKP